MEFNKKEDILSFKSFVIENDAILTFKNGIKDKNY